MDVYQPQPEPSNGTVITVRATYMERAAEWSRSIVNYTGSKVASLFAPPDMGFSFGTIGVFSPYTAKQAMQDNAELRNAIDERSMKLANLPVYVYSDDGPDTPPLPRTEKWVYWFYSMLDTPDPLEQGQDFPTNGGYSVLVQMFADLFLHGTAFAHVTYDRGTKPYRPVGFVRIDPAVMQFDKNRRQYYSYSNGYYTWYPRGELVVIRGLSTDDNTAFGIGAYQPLRYILEALTNATKLIAKQAKQGAIGFVISGEDDPTRAALNNPKTRAKLDSDMKKMLEQGNSYVISPGAVKISPVSARAADLGIKELTDSATSAILTAAGKLDNKTSNYATAVMMARVQSEYDAAYCRLFCDLFLTRLARAVARSFGVNNSSSIIVELDQSSTFAMTSQLTDAINRAERLSDLGADPQAALYSQGVYNVKLVNPRRISGNGANSSNPTPVGDGQTQDNGNTVTGKDSNA